jgi:hypothetical protein
MRPCDFEANLASSNSFRGLYRFESPLPILVSAKKPLLWIKPLNWASMIF